MGQARRRAAWPLVALCAVLLLAHWFLGLFLDRGTQGLRFRPVKSPREQEPHTQYPSPTSITDAIIGNTEQHGHGVPPGVTSNHDGTHGQQLSRPEPDTTALGRRRRARHLCILSMYFGTSLPLKPITQRTKQEYARRWGYAYYNVYDNPEVQEQLRGALESERYSDLLFNKLPALNIFIDKCEWIFWSDADAIFLNHSKPLAPFIDDRYDVIFPAGPPHSVRWRKVINTGHFFLRGRSEWSKQFIEATIQHSKRPCNHSIPLFNGWLRLCKETCCEWGEQGAMMEVLQQNKEWQRHVKYVGFRDYGSQVPFWGEGDMVVHMPGRTAKERVDTFTALVKTADFETGTYKKEDIPISPAVRKMLRPVYNKDHVYGLDYSSINPSHPLHS